MEQLLVEARKAHPSWGGRKVKDVLEREHPGVKLPAPSTIAAILKRHGLVWQGSRESSRSAKG